ncbi:MAG: hypothetical protein RML72_02075 [Bacteroidia bacterium]|nr:hypothetical protein [Bacteroidia bacterium]MDW8157648.1 hypothetical protein [Bacteroidia bacterium]
MQEQQSSNPETENTLSTQEIKEQELLKQLRYYFGMASRAYQYWKEGWCLLEENKEINLPTFQAYRWAWKAIEAKYLKNPYEQLSHIQQVLPELTKLTRNYPQSIEILFIRTAIISNLPSLFNMQIEASRDTRRLIATLENHWNTLDPHLKEAIVRFLDISIYIEMADKKKIQAWLAHGSS